jgi:hypothetical protein
VFILTFYQEYRKGANGSKESINDDIVFEIELVQQVEVNIDYILMLVAKYQKSNCKDKSILTTIDKAINSSIKLRSKKELIENFVEQVNVSTQIDEEWQRYLQECKEKDIALMIEEERLKPEETRRFIDTALRDGMLKTTGTAIDKIMPPMSRFGGGRDVKKRVLSKSCRNSLKSILGWYSADQEQCCKKEGYQNFCFLFGGLATAIRTCGETVLLRLFNMGSASDEYIDNIEENKPQDLLYVMEPILKMSLQTCT